MAGPAASSTGRWPREVSAAFPVIVAGGLNPDNVGELMQRSSAVGSGCLERGGNERGEGRSEDQGLHSGGEVSEAMRTSSAATTKRGPPRTDMDFRLRGNDRRKTLPAMAPEVLHPHLRPLPSRERRFLRAPKVCIEDSLQEKRGEALHPQLPGVPLSRKRELRCVGRGSSPAHRNAFLRSPVWGVQGAPLRPSPRGRG